MKGKTLTGEDAAAEINISPLIDMVFILLIFFIVTTVFVEESGLNFETPVPVPPTTMPDREPFVLRISEGGAVFLGEKEIGKGGVKYAIINARNQGVLEAVTVEVDPLAKVFHVAAVLDICASMKLDKVITKTTAE